jgi:hypothetical protein
MQSGEERFTAVRGCQNRLVEDEVVTLATKLLWIKMM